MKKVDKDLIIIGGGPSGLTAAIYTSRASIDTLVIEGNPYGGQLMLTSDVENFPGFVNGIAGPELIENMREQAKRFGTKLLGENVVKVSGTSLDGFLVELSDGSKYTSRTILVASGASAKWLGLASEKKLMGKGVSACATCDGFFFKNKVIAVVGAGDAAMEEANYLTRFASKVYVLVRGSKEKMRASKIMIDRAQSNAKIEFLFNTEVKEVLGEDKVSGLVVTNLDGSVGTLSDVQGLFVAIGHKPNTDFLNGFVNLDHMGYLMVSDGTKTSVEGVFSGGDVSDHRYRQAITAAGFGCMAALDIEKYLNEHHI